MKIAIVHEMLIKLWGAEKVVEKLTKMFPDANVFTLIYDEKKVGHIFPKKNPVTGKTIRSPFLTQWIYDVTGKQRLCLPFMAKWIESFNFSKYDVVIVSSSGFAHGVITKPDTKTIVYYHSPARYLWDWTNEYKRDIKATGWIKWYLLNKLFLKLRIWDIMASERGDILLANSENVKKRIEKYYRREATVLYPPIELERFKEEKNIENFDEIYGFHPKSYFIIVATLTEFKKIELALEAFKKNGKRLVIIWDGNHRYNLEEQAKWYNNIVFLWAKYSDELVLLVQQSVGMIFPWEEDFWIVPIEAMAAGIPVFAYGKGGLLETVQENISGNFFYKSDGSDFEKNFEIFEDNIINWKFNKDTIVESVEKFNEIHFEEAVNKLVLEK
jgi:glycosyltransferase involved in cell wall biosynthesis